jgi:hypothetical protein
MGYTNFQKGGSMIQYHNPEAEVGVDKIPYELSTVVKGSGPIGIGFLANGFPDSENFLREVALAMQAIEPDIKVFPYNKGNASIPANESLLAEIHSHCTAAVAAYGH